jgi:peptide/nickel transport system permease protein
MYAGQVVERGASRQVIAAPRMPYTRALLDATPRIEAVRPRGSAIPGRPPDTGRAPAGCRFHARCPRAQAHCATEAPPLAGPPDHEYRCWHPL